MSRTHRTRPFSVTFSEIVKNSRKAASEAAWDRLTHVIEAEAVRRELYPH